jgi:cell division protein FtsX
VSAGADELPTWRALGADRGVVVRAMVLPTLVTALIGAIAGLDLAVALTPRYPIATTRLWEVHHRVHFDWLVLGLGAFTLVVAIIGSAWVTSEIRVRRSERVATRSPASRLIGNSDLPPALVFGSQLATEPGRGRRAVPVRSALIGAIVGVLGFVGCLTFRTGLTDAVDNKARTGIVWDHALGNSSEFSRDVVTTMGKDPAVAGALRATWARAIVIDGRGQAVWFTEPVTGEMPFVIVDGRAPRGPNEIVLGASTLSDDGYKIGQTVRVGPGPGRPVAFVGTALLPPSSHTTYDESAWMSADGLDESVPAELPDQFYEDYVLLKFKPDADRNAAVGRLEPLAEYSVPAKIAPEVATLGHMRSLPFALAIFFVLLACATVAHALVTTVRRRERDLAVLRAIGFTRQNTRVAIAWQATVLATIGVLVGVPLGVVAGRLAWRRLAEDFPVFYAPPLALLAVLLVIPLAIIVANLLAAGPARSATRLRPAEVLRTE